MTVTSQSSHLYTRFSVDGLHSLVRDGLPLGRGASEYRSGWTRNARTAFVLPLVHARDFSKDQAWPALGG